MALATAIALAWSPALCKELDQDLTEIGIEAVMDIEVTSVLKKPQRQIDAAAAIYVITREDILRSGATSIPEALRLAPGVHVARIDSNKWAIGVRGFTSRLSRSLLVLIDGRSVYSPLFAGVYWEVQDTLLEDIERIEVIRGPGAALWGANAVNGVINIITRDARQTQGPLASLVVGDEERFIGALRFGGIRNGFGYRAYGKYFDRDGGFHASGSEFDAWHMGRIGFRVDGDVGATNSFTFQGDLYDGKSGQRTTVTTYTAPYSSTIEEDADLSGGNLFGKWRRVFSEASGMELRFYYDRTDRREPSFQEKRDTYDLEFQHYANLSERHDLLWGLGYRVTSDETSAVPTTEFVPADRTDDLASAFVQDEIELVPSRLNLIVGSKFERNDYSGFEYQPNVRLLWSATSRQTFWAAVSRAIRVPSRIEDDLTLTALIEPATPTFARLIGTDDFRPEQLLAYETGYRVEATEALFVRLSTFYNDYDSLLSLEPGAPFTETSPPPDHTVIPFFFGNKMAAKLYGGELACDWRPTASWRIAGSYSHLRIDMQPDADSLDPSTERSVEGSSPRHAAVLQSYVDLSRRLGLDVTVRHVSSLAAQRVDGYTEMDASFRWRPRDSLELSIVGRNLLDDHHAEFGGGSSGPTEVERSLHGRLGWRW